MKWMHAAAVLAVLSGATWLPIIAVAWVIFA